MRNEKMGIKGKMTFKLIRNGEAKKLWNENLAGKLIRKITGLSLRLMPFGYYDDKKVVRNLITNTGLAGLASRLNGDGSAAAFTYLALGTGTTGAAAGNTALEAEITDSGLERAAATPSRDTDTATNDTAVLTKTWTASGTKAVTEAGALNADVAGILLGRQVFDAINVVSGDSLQITYEFTFANAA
jgi:hypothetical protein